MYLLNTTIFKILTFLYITKGGFFISADTKKTVNMTPKKVSIIILLTVAVSEAILMLAFYIFTVEPIYSVLLDSILLSIILIPVMFIYVYKPLHTAKEKCEVSELRYRSLIDNVPGMVYKANSDWSIDFISGHEQLCGYSVEEINELDNNWLSVVHPNDKEKILSESETISTKEQSIIQVYRIITKSGEVKWVEDHKKSSFFDTENQFSIDGIVIDITESKMMEKTLIESETRYKYLSENSTDWIWEFDENEIFTYASKAVINILGYTPEEVLGKSAFDFIPSPEREKVKKEFVAFKETKKNFSNLLNVNQHKSGRMVFLESSGVPIVDRDGTFRGYRGIDRDISERMRSKEMLQQSEEKYRSLSNAALEGIALTENGKIIEINNAACKLSGYTASELIGMQATEMIAPEMRPDVEQKMISGFEQPYDTKCLRKDNSTYPAKIHGKNLHYQGREVRVVTIYDLSDRKKLEKEQIKSEKLETATILAGGIAHDFNNLLSLIMGNTELALSDIGGTSPANEKMQNVMVACEQAVNLTRKFLTLSDAYHPLKETVSVKDLLKRVLSHHTDKEKLPIDIFIAEDLWKVQIDSEKIVQALNEIVLNAREAIDKQGHVLVTAENIDQEAKELVLGKNKLSPKYIKISIKDDGPGITEDTINNIFDPYFSTKQRGTQKGMGLGLTLANTIIKKNNGHINLESTVNSGTNIMIFLPAVEI